MNLNYKHLGMYLLAGIVSGLLCGLINPLLEERFGDDHGSGLVLGIMIFLAGRYISDIAPRNTWLSPLILVLACAIGWFLAYQFGYEFSYLAISFFSSGAIGGIFVAIGLALAWKLNRVWLVIALTVLAGILGVLMWYLVSGISDAFGFELGFFLLFVSWQAILLLAIGIAVQIDSNKSSTATLS